MITSVASLTDLSEQYRTFGRCHLVSGTQEKFQDYHRWIALCQTARYLLTKWEEALNAKFISK